MALPPFGGLDGLLWWCLWQEVAEAELALLAALVEASQFSLWGGKSAGLECPFVVAGAHWQL